MSQRSFKRRFGTLAQRPAMQCVGFIVLPGFQMMSVGALCVFEFANKDVGEAVYDAHLLSETGGSIRSSIGISVATEPFDDTNFGTLCRRQRLHRIVNARRNQIYASSSKIVLLAGGCPVNRRK